MSDQKPEPQVPGGGNEDPATAVKPKPRKAPAPTKPRQLPPYKVLLHNDDVNDMLSVVKAILKITPLSLGDAEARTWEAHKTGVALLLVTHKERAELYQEQFATFNLTVSIEPDI